MPKPTTKQTIAPLAIRKKLGLNQSQFWNPLGCTQSAGSRYEGGRAMPKPLQKLMLIAHGSPAMREATLRSLVSLPKGAE